MPVSALSVIVCNHLPAKGELLNCEIFCSLKEARILIEDWRKHYNIVRPHSALGYLPPAPECIVPIDQWPVRH